MAITTGTSKWKSLLRSERKPCKADDGRERCHSGSTSGPKRSPHPTTTSFSEKYRRTTKVLGQSDAGSVFVALRRRDDRCVAVKRFARPLNPASEETQVRKIVAEFWVGSQLKHDNVAQSLELLREEDGTWFQVMEYVPLNLFDRVCSKKMSREEINCAFMQIVAGTAYLHQSGVAHRDLKLENVVYTESGVMKLIDFGAAAVCKRDEHPVALLHGSVGTRPYMAPELIRRKPYNPRSTDVWSLAILYCCMVMQRFPWKEASFSDRDFAVFIDSSSHLSDSMKKIPRPQSTAGIPSPKSSPTTSAPLHRVISSEKSDSICIVVAEVSGRDSTEIQAASANTRRWKPSQTFSDDCWAVLGGMLQIDDQKRLTMQEVQGSAWVRRTKTCAGQEEERGQGHSHV